MPLPGIEPGTLPMVGDVDGPGELAAGISSVVSSSSSASTCSSPMALCEEDKYVKRLRTGEAPESAHRNPYEVRNEFRGAVK